MGAGVRLVVGVFVIFLFATLLFLGPMFLGPLGGWRAKERAKQVQQVRTEIVAVLEKVGLHP